MKILITGFQPFGGETINPALEAVLSLSKKQTRSTLIPLEVPTEFNRAADIVLGAISFHSPDAVILVGQAGGRAAVTPERVAINCMDARIPDNAGFQPIDMPIVQPAPAAYFSTLPIRAITDAIRKAGLPAQISNSAGTYVCNALMYGVLHGLSERGVAIPCGFIHVPYCPAQTAEKPDQPSMALDDIVRALECAVNVLERA